MNFESIKSYIEGVLREYDKSSTSCKSFAPTDDEVRIFWLVCEIDRMGKEHKKEKDKLMTEVIQLRDELKRRTDG